MLLEVPPHGCCMPWPETTGRVAEWCDRDAGRRSAGLGSKGVTRTHTHAVGVRARVEFPQVLGIHQSMAIWLVAGHKQGFEEGDENLRFLCNDTYTHNITVR